MFGFQGLGVGGQFKIGDRVEYRGGWGADAPRLGTIDSDDGEKNDRRIYGVKLDCGASHWGYANQFTKIGG
jgi:hypothetical protein